MKDFTKVKIVTNVPTENANAIRQALGDAGAGVIGEYSYCSFTIKGQGRSFASDKSNPYIGKIGSLNSVAEDRVEVVCARKYAKKAIAAMKKVHPHEEVAYDIYPLLEDDDL